MRTLGVCVAAATLALPAIANACPSCATREGGSGVYVMVGLMITVPYLVAAVAFKVIRRTLSRDERPQPSEVRP